MEALSSAGPVDAPNRRLGAACVEGSHDMAMTHAAPRLGSCSMSHTKAMMGLIALLMRSGLSGASPYHPPFLGSRSRVILWPQ